MRYIIWGGLQAHQTPSGEKKGLWHITGKEDKRSMYGLCNSFGYYVGGYRDDKPEMKGPKRAIYNGQQNLCPACVQQAYIQEIITIKPVKTKIWKN